MKKLALALILSCAPVLFAQPGNPGGSGIDASLIRLFGDVKVFSAKGTVVTRDSQEKETSSMPVTFALLDGKMRAEMDLSEMKNSMMPAEAAAMIKATGMDKLQMLMVPEKKSTVLIYPGLQSYASVGMSSEETADAKAEITEIGKETINGHSCIKKKVSATDSKGKVQDAFVWAATDLKNFPIQIEMKQKRQTVRINFNAPSFDKPDAKLFDLPAGYTKYDSIQAMMQAGMMKMLGGGR
jgi:hypothetical protein